MASPPEELPAEKTASSRVPCQWKPPVTCVQCGGELKDPHLLACLHCLCRECLPRAAGEDGRLRCPALNCGDCSTTWRQPDVVALPRCEERARECVPVQCATVGRYVEGRKIVRRATSGEQVTCGFPQCENDSRAQVTIYCFDCRSFFCGSCETGHRWMVSMRGEQHDVRSVEAIRSAAGESIASICCKAVPLYCPRHKGKVLEYHCVTCDLLMCQACTVDKDSPHRPAFLSAEEPLPPQHLYTMELAQRVVSCSKEQCGVDKEHAKGWAREVAQKKEAALRNTRRSFQEIREAINRREEELCGKISSASEAREANVTDCIRSYHQKEDALSNRQAMLSFLSTEGSAHELITYRRVVGAGPAHRRSVAAVPRVMEFLPKQEAALRAAIKGFGCVEVGAFLVNCTLDPSPSRVRKCSDKVPVVFTLITADHENFPCSIGGEDIQAFLRPSPPLPGPSIKAAVNDEKNGHYKVIFKHTYTGECELSVLVNGSHVLNSPFAVELHQHLQSQFRFLLTRDVKTLGACKGTLQFPEQPGRLTCVAVGPSGYIFVTDHSQHKIHVFDAERKFVNCIGGQGTGNGQLRCPTSVAITSEGLLYVTNTNGVDVLKENGAFVRRIVSGSLSSPWDVAIHDGEIFVADRGNSSVRIFNNAGEHVRTIGEKGSGPGQFSGATSVAVSLNGELYVSDFGNSRIQVVTTQGDYIRECHIEQICQPHKLQFSTAKHVLVANEGNNRIAVCNQVGTLVKTLACASIPVGLAVDRKGDLLVACWDGKCVQIF